MRRCLRTAIVACSVVTAVVLGSAAPAAAHSTYWEIRKYWWATLEGTMTISDSHASIAICDEWANNNGVTAEFWYRLPGRFDDLYQSIGDGNGSAGGCGSYTVPSGGWITSARGSSARGTSTGWVTP